MTEPKVGGYEWRYELNLIAEREVRQSEITRKLMDHARTPETVQLLADLLLLQNKNIDAAHRLRRVKDKK